MLASELEEVVPWAALSLGNLYEQLADAPAARAACARAIPEASPVAAVKLADELRAQGDADEAEAVYRVALRYAGGFEGRLATPAGAQPHIIGISLVRARAHAQAPVGRRSPGFKTSEIVGSFAGLIECGVLFGLALGDPVPIPFPGQGDHQESYERYGRNNQGRPVLGHP